MVAPGVVRRIVLLLCASAALLGSAACSEDTPDVPAAPPARTIAFLRAVASNDASGPEAFFAELAKGGYVKGRNLAVLGEDASETHTDPADIERAVKAWHAEGVDLVLALSSSGAQVAAKVDPTLMVLFLSNDPTAVGLVRSETEPERNLTGATFRVPADRTLDVTRQALDAAQRVGFLFPPEDPAALPGRDRAVAAATGLGMELLVEPFSGPQGVGPAAQKVAASGVHAILVSNSPTTVRAFPSFREAAAQLRVPFIANTATASDFALLVLEPDTRQLYRQMARQAVRLLNGADPSEVPVEDPARFRLVVNRSVAARLGVTLKPEFIDRADQVID